MSAVVPWAATPDERKVIRTLRTLAPKHARALRAYMAKEPVERLDLEAAIDAFRQEWAA